MSIYETSEDKDEGTGESGYSDVENTVSGLSEAATSYSLDEIPPRQISTQVKQRHPKERTTKQLTNKSKEAVSRTYKEPGGMSHVKDIVPVKNTFKKTKTKQVGKKGMYVYHVFLTLDRW